MQQLKKDSAHRGKVGAVIETNAGGANFYPQYTRLSPAVKLSPGAGVIR